jgi:hypothetical protein
MAEQAFAGCSRHDDATPKVTAKYTHWPNTNGAVEDDLVSMKRTRGDFFGGR